MDKSGLMVEKDFLIFYRRLLSNRVKIILDKYGCNDPRALVFSSAYQVALSYFDFALFSFDSVEFKKKKRCNFNSKS